MMTSPSRLSVRRPAGQRHAAGTPDVLSEPLEPVPPAAERAAGYSAVLGALLRDICTPHEGPRP